MIVIAGLILGVLTGDFRARRAGGNGKDRAQWAAVHALIFGVAGLLITIFVHRSSI